MSYLELVGSLDSIRLNIGSSGARHASGSARVRLTVGDESRHHEDEGWASELCGRWELVGNGEHYVPTELHDLSRDEPDRAHALVHLKCRQLSVFVSTGVRRLDDLWTTFGAHLGAPDVFFSLTIPMETDYGFGHVDRSARMDLEAGSRIVSVAMLAVFPRGWMPAESSA